MTKYEKYSKEQLIRHIEELEKQLKSTKYGLYWDKSIEQEKVIQKMISNIPFLSTELGIKDRSKKATNNILISGDNFEALSLLSFISSPEGLVDLIYIDPPYNTGNKDFMYNDDFVDIEDGYRHSKWLGFMEKRLKLAREILREDGLIFISIDDNEQANLEILCNSVFGEKNLLTKFIWEKTQHFGRQKVNFYSNCEYVLCYSKKLFDTDNLKLKELLVESFNDNLQDAPLYNASNPEKTLIFPPGSVLFNIPDGLYLQSTNPQYELIEPVNVENGKNSNQLVLRFRSRWSAETVLEENSKGTTFWVKTKNFAIRTIYHEGKTSKTSPKQIVFTNTNNPMVAKSRFDIKPGVNEEGSKELSDLMTQNIFSYPKPKSLIKYLLSMYYDYRSEDFHRNPLVLDFFAGSGTTGQAVLELNQEDGGNRRFILCTNNENNICTDVTYPRLKTVITGIRPDGTKYSDGIPANLHYFKCDFIPNVGNADQAKFNLVEKVNNLLCIAEDVYDLVDSSPRHYVYQSNDGHKQVFMYIDYFEEKSFKEFKKKIVDSKAESKVVYMFSTDNVIDDLLFKDIKGVEIKPIPSKIYEIYKDIVEDIKRG